MSRITTDGISRNDRQSTDEQFMKAKESASVAAIQQPENQDRISKLQALVRKTSSLAIIALFAVFAGYYVWDNLPVYVEILTKLTTGTIAIYFLLSGSILYVDGLSLRLFLKPFGIRLNHYFLVSCVSSLINQLTPFRGGLAFKAWYMKKVYDFGYMKSAIITVGEYVLIFLIVSALAIVNMGWLYQQHGIFNLWMTLIFAGLFLGCFIAILLNRVRLSGRGRLSKALNSVLTNWKTLVRYPGQILWLSLYTVINIGITFLMFVVMSTGIGYPLPYSIALQLSLLSYLAFFVNITPGSVGVLEFVCLIGGVSLGLQTERLVLLLLVMRTVRSVSVFVYGIVSKPILLHSVKRSDIVEMQRK